MRFAISLLILITNSLCYSQDRSYYSCDTTDIPLLLDTVYNKNVRINEVFVLNTKCFLWHLIRALNDTTVTSFNLSVDSIAFINEFIGKSPEILNYYNNYLNRKDLTWDMYVKQYYLVQTKSTRIIYIRSYKYEKELDFVSIRKYPINIFSDQLGDKYFAVNYIIDDGKIEIIK